MDDDFARIEEVEKSIDEMFRYQICILCGFTRLMENPLFQSACERVRRIKKTIDPILTMARFTTVFRSLPSCLRIASARYNRIPVIPMITTI